MVTCQLRHCLNSQGSTFFASTARQRHNGVSFGIAHGPVALQRSWKLATNSKPTGYKTPSTFVFLIWRSKHFLFTMSHQDRKPTPQNVTLLQGFEWNVPADRNHYKRLTAQLPQLTKIGISNIWLPPGCKASSNEGNGYDIYDLYDLGEFEQKGTRSTKWGSKEDLLELSKKGKELGVGLYWDAVLNHKAGADKTERCKVVEVDENDRTKDITEPYEIEAWVGFDFPGREEKYSKMKWHWYHFSGTDWNEENKKKAIYRIVGENKGWSSSVDKEQGNADYMMFADIDYHHPEVCKDTMHWGPWIVDEIGLKGFRLDAVQHFSENFTSGWVDNLRKECGDDIFIVGEFWVGDVQKMTEWLGKMGKKFSLFDAPLLNNFHNISKTEQADLRKLFDNSLVQVEPVNAVVSPHRIESFVQIDH